MGTPQHAHAMLAAPIHDEASRQDFVRDFRLHLATAHRAHGEHPSVAAHSDAALAG